MVECKKLIAVDIALSLSSSNNNKFDCKWVLLMKMPMLIQYFSGDAF